MSRWLTLWQRARLVLRNARPADGTAGVHPWNHPSQFGELPTLATLRLPSQRLGDRLARQGSGQATPVMAPGTAASILPAGMRATLRLAPGDTQRARISGPMREVCAALDRLVAQEQRRG